MKKFLSHMFQPGAALIIGAITGWFFISVVANHYVYQKARAETNKLERAKLERITLLQRPSLWYGTVVSVDPKSGTLVAEFINHFAAPMQTIPITIQTDGDTSFIEQTLIPSGDVYVGLSERTAGSLSRLRPGMRISALFENKGDEGVLATMIIYGSEPL